MLFKSDNMERISTEIHLCLFTSVTVNKLYKMTVQSVFYLTLLLVSVVDY